MRNEPKILQYRSCTVSIIRPNLFIFNVNYFIEVYFLFVTLSTSIPFTFYFTINNLTAVLTLQCKILYTKHMKNLETMMLF